MLDNILSRAEWRRCL